LTTPPRTNVRRQGCRREVGVSAREGTREQQRSARMSVPFREASIDLAAIAHNVSRLRSITGVPVIGVVKANGYGHGAAEVATAALAGGATRLGTATIEESLALRRAGITAPLMAWLHAPDRRFDDAVEAR